MSVHTGLTFFTLLGIKCELQGSLGSKACSGITLSHHVTLALRNCELRTISKKTSKVVGLSVELFYLVKKMKQFHTQLKYTLLYGILY